MQNLTGITSGEEKMSTLDSGEFLLMSAGVVIISTVTYLFTILMT